MRCHRDRVFHPVRAQAPRSQERQSSVPGDDNYPTEALRQLHPNQRDLQLALPDQRLAVVIDDDPDREDWLTHHDWTVIRHQETSTTLENITAALAKGTR